MNTVARVKSINIPKTSPIFFNYCSLTDIFKTTQTILRTLLAILLAKYGLIIRTFLGIHKF